MLTLSFSLFSYCRCSAIIFMIFHFIELFMVNLVFYVYPFCLFAHKCRLFTLSTFWGDFYFFSLSFFCYCGAWYVAFSIWTQLFSLYLLLIWRVRVFSLLNDTERCEKWLNHFMNHAFLSIYFTLFIHSIGFFSRPLAFSL